MFPKMIMRDTRYYKKLDVYFPYLSITVQCGVDTWYIFENVLEVRRLFQETYIGSVQDVHDGLFCTDKTHELTERLRKAVDDGFEVTLIYHDEYHDTYTKETRGELTDNCLCSDSLTMIDIVGTIDGKEASITADVDLNKKSVEVLMQFDNQDITLANLLDDTYAAAKKIADALKEGRLNAEVTE